MNLCIDQGNTKAKIGLFDRKQLIHTVTVDELNLKTLDSILDVYPVHACIYSNVGDANESIMKYLNKKVQHSILLSHQTSIPITNHYLTPETLGKDRLAAVVGAAYLRPQSDILVIDAGTAITYDFIDAKYNYLGGNISAGIDMRLKALHAFTQKLPAVQVDQNVSFLGNNTQTALQAGTLYGIVFEIDGYISSLKIKYPKLSTFLTGGSAIYFDSKLKNTTFAETNLVLIGLNRILEYNVQK
jgi:type III pantothenate kinase